MLSYGLSGNSLMESVVLKSGCLLQRDLFSDFT